MIFYCEFAAETPTPCVSSTIFESVSRPVYVLWKMCPNPESPAAQIGAPGYHSWPWLYSRGRPRAICRVGFQAKI